MFGRTLTIFWLVSVFFFGGTAVLGQATVQRLDFEKTLIFTGELEAVESARISPPSVSRHSSYTIAYMAPEGTLVQAGDMVVRFDSSELEPRRLDMENQREEARIQIAQREADIGVGRQDLLLALATAEKNYAVAKIYADLDPQLISRAQAEEYRFTFDNAGLDLEKARERLENFEKSSSADLRVVQLDFEKADLELRRILADLDRMSVRATTAGLVIYAVGDEGRKFQVGDSVYRRQEVVLLPNMDKLKVVITVFDTDFRSLEVGAPAEVILDAFPERVFKAEVTRLPEVARPIDSRSELNVFLADVVLIEKDLTLMKPGMTARVRVPVQRPNALAIPRKAVRLGENGQPFVRLAGPEPADVNVNLIDSSDDWVVVDGGLSEGSPLQVSEAEVAGHSRAEDDWITVQRDNLRFAVSGSGVLRSEKAVMIRPPSIRRTHRFKIVEMIPEGSQARVGDVLVRFDETDQMRQLREEQANLDKVAQELEKTQARLELQNRDLELELEDARVQLEKSTNKLRQSRQFESTLAVQEAELEQILARTRVEALERKVQLTAESTRLQLQVLTDKQELHHERMANTLEAIKKLTVKAPIDGVAIYVANWNNEKNQVGSEVHSMTPVMSLPDMTTLQVQGQVAEVDAGKIAVGQEVIVDIDALPDRSFSGHISEISSVFKPASFDRPVKALEIYVDLDELDARRMRPGMVTRLQIVLDYFENVLAVPLSVIEVEHGRSFVWVREGNQPVRRAIEVGEDNGVVAVVESGLSEGDQVLKKPATMVAE